MRISRTDVRGVPCPYCKSGPGEQCIGARQKLREANHMERVKLYNDVLSLIAQRVWIRG